jgi:hypothetical protein
MSTPGKETPSAGATCDDTPLSVVPARVHAPLSPHPGEQLANMRLDGPRPPLQTDLESEPCTHLEADYGPAAHSLPQPPPLPPPPPLQSGPGYYDVPGPASGIYPAPSRTRPGACASPPIYSAAARLVGSDPGNSFAAASMRWPRIPERVATFPAGPLASLCGPAAPGRCLPDPGGPSEDGLVAALVAAQAAGHSGYECAGSRVDLAVTGGALTSPDQDGVLVPAAAEAGGSDEFCANAAKILVATLRALSISRRTHIMARVEGCFPAQTKYPKCQVHTYDKCGCFMHVMNLNPTLNGRVASIKLPVHACEFIMLRLGVFFPVSVALARVVARELTPTCAAGIERWVPHVLDARVSSILS